MPKKVNCLINNNASILLIGCIFLLGACASQNIKTYDDYQHMTCDEITAEIQKLNTEIAQAKNNKELGRAVDTGTTVAAQGASIAGVPYVGAVVSIGKTLLNHKKQTTVDDGFIAQENLFALEGVAYEKGCL